MRTPSSRIWPAAKKRWRERRGPSRSANPLAKLDLVDFVPAISPRFSAPHHLPQLLDYFRRVDAGEEVRGLLSVPRRHAKTETLLHGIAWLLLRHPDWMIGYAGYNDDFVRTKSRLARDYARKAGVQLRSDSTSVNEWLTTSGGGVIARGIGGSWTGHGVQLFIVDDPHKDRTEAESAAHRRRVHDFHSSVGVSSVEPAAGETTGGSMLGVHTRWHEDDYIGRLLNDEEAAWEYTNLPAINDGTDPNRGLGEPLWPDRWPLDRLLKRKADVGEFEWASLYQGHPRPRGAQIFSGDVFLYDELPAFGYQVSVAIDLAYSKKKTADWSVLLVMLGTMTPAGPRYYVVDVVRMQGPPSAFAARAEPVLTEWPAIDWSWRVAGQEGGVADLLRDAPHHLPIRERPTTSDKFISSQPVAAAWNRGEVLFPSKKAAETNAIPNGDLAYPKKGMGWVAKLISEVKGFTGQDGATDDQVDTLITAHEDLSASFGAGASLQIIQPAHW